MFGKGNRSKKRGIWIFGGIMRNNGKKEGFDFSEIRQKVLWRIIQKKPDFRDNNTL